MGLEVGPRDLAVRVAAYAPVYVLPPLMGLASIPVLARTLGPAEFGAYALCLTIHLLLLTLAADPTTNAIRRLYATERGEEADRLLRAGLGLALALATSVAGVATIAAVVVALAGGDPEWAARVSAVAFATCGFTIFQYGVVSFYVREHVARTSRAQAVHAVAKPTALALGAIAAGTAVASFVSYGVVAFVLAVWLVLAGLRLPYPLVDRARWRRSLSYGVPLIGVSMSIVAVSGFDRLALGALRGEAAAGRYAIAYLVSDFAVAGVGMLLGYAIYPTLTRLWEAERRDAVRRTIRAAVDAYLVVGTTVLGVLAVGGSEIIEAMGGSGFETSAAVPVLVGAGVLLYRVAYFESVGFELALRSKGLAGTFLMTTATCIPVTVAAVLADGVRGAAIATLATFVVFWLLVRARNPLADYTAYPVGRLAAVLAAMSLLAFGASYLPLDWGFALVGLVQPAVAVVVLGRTPDVLSAARSFLG